MPERHHGRDIVDELAEQPDLAAAGIIDERRGSDLDDDSHDETLPVDDLV
jgi:hypothetical protein